MSIKTIIIDDEKASRTLLKAMLEKYCQEIEVIALCEDLPTGVKTIRKQKPDLIFLDIEMPGHSGLELLEFFNEDEVEFSIIFTTAYNHYAIQAFKLSAVDYLLKPIEREELVYAIERYKKKTVKPNYTLLKENITQPVSQKIAIPTGSSIRFLALNEIVYLKADGSYTHIILENNDKIMVSKSLKQYEELLIFSDDFIRCHKSYLVNVNYIKEYIKSDGGSLRLKNNHEISISPEKSDEVLNRLNYINR
jgi:two-component system LytT family response regulator